MFILLTLVFTATFDLTSITILVLGAIIFGNGNHKVACAIRSIALNRMEAVQHILQLCISPGLKHEPYFRSTNYVVIHEFDLSNGPGT